MHQKKPAKDPAFRYGPAAPIKAKAAARPAKPKPKTKDRAELESLRNERSARELCESLEFNETPIQVRAIARMENAKDRRELAKEFKRVSKQTFLNSVAKP